MRKNHARNSLFSLISLLLPVVLGLVFIPNFISDFGKERFAFLTLIWSLLGYFSFLDLGIGRTLTKIIAQKINDKDFASSSFIGVAQVAVLLVSASFACIVFLATETIALRFLQISEILHDEFLIAIKIVAFGIPFVTMTSVNRAILEGLQDFYRANILQVLSGVFLFMAPFFAWKIAPSMVSVCLGIVLGRVVLYGLSYYFYKQRIPISVMSFKNFSAHLKILFSHGAWITASNVLSPLMANFDKFLLGHVLSLKNIVYYTTPMEMISRLWAIPTGVTRVFFPLFAAAEDSQETQNHFRAATQIMGFFMFPACLVLFVFSEELLRLWLGEEFAKESFLLAKIMIFGVMFNCFNWIPFGWLQATRYVRWTVFTVIIELPLFFIAFFYFTREYHLVGAATVWAGRLIFDYFLTYGIASYFRTKLFKEFIYSFAYLILSFGIFVGLSLISDLIYKICLSSLCLIGFLIFNFKLIKEMVFK